MPLTPRARERACRACGEPDGLRIWLDSDYDTPACRYCGVVHEVHVTAACGILAADVQLLQDDDQVAA